MNWTIGYIILIVLVNIGFVHIPLLPVLGEMWPPMSIAVGLVFVARDFSQREIGHKVWIAMLVAGVLSYVMADPFVAIASVTAFMISEGIDWAIYSFTHKPFRQRIIYSSLVSTPIDSAVFLAMINHLSITGVIIMTLSKMLAALVIWRWIGRDDSLPRHTNHP